VDAAAVTGQIVVETEIVSTISEPVEQAVAAIFLLVSVLFSPAAPYFLSKSGKDGGGGVMRGDVPGGQEIMVNVDVL
jgi:hypothetical protein